MDDAVLELREAEPVQPSPYEVGEMAFSGVCRRAWRKTKKTKKKRSIIILGLTQDDQKPVDLCQPFPVYRDGQGVAFPEQHNSTLVSLNPLRSRSHRISSTVRRTDAHRYHT